MKKLLLFSFLLSSCLAFSQIGVKISNIRPTGEFGAAVKPALGFEVNYTDFDYEESEFRFGISLGFAKFSPRLDTFPTYGVISGSGTRVLPGFTVVQKYSILSLKFGADYMLNLNDAFYFYPGIQVGLLFSSLSYDSYTPEISSESYSGGYVYAGARLKIGSEYSINERCSVFAEAARNMNFSPEVRVLAYNDYGLGVRYFF